MSQPPDTFRSSRVDDLEVGLQSYSYADLLQALGVDPPPDPSSLGPAPAPPPPPFFVPASQLSSPPPAYTRVELDLPPYVSPLPPSTPQPRQIHPSPFSSNSLLLGMGAPPSYNSTMSPIEPVFKPVPDPLFRTSEPDPSPYRPSQAFPPTHPAQGRESLRHPPPPRPPKPVINSPKPRPKQDTYARELLAEASKQNTKIIAMEKFTATKVGHGYHAIDSEKSSPPKPSQVPASSAPVTSPPTIAPPVQTKPQEPQLPPHYYEEDAEKEGCCRKCVRHRIRHKCSVALVLSIFLFVLSLLGTGYQLINNLFNVFRLFNLCNP